VKKVRLTETANFSVVFDRLLHECGLGGPS
jgi:hypothetical protein